MTTHTEADSEVALMKARLHKSNFTVCLSMCSHLISSSFSSNKNLKIIDTVLLKCLDILIKCFDFSEIRWLGKSLSCCLFSSNQPRCELLNASSVLSPVLDIIGIFVTLNPCIFLKISAKLGYSVKLILESLGIRWNLLTLGEKI